MELEKLIAPLVLDDTAYKDGLEAAAGQAGGFLGSLGKGGAIAAGAVGLAATAVVGVGTALVASTKDAITWGNTLDSISDSLGTTAEESAAFAVMTKRLGMGTDAIIKPMNKFISGLEGVDGKAGPTGKTLEALGISFRDANGEMRDATSIIQDVANRVDNLPEGFEKTQVLMDLFGKTGAEMGDFLDAAANGGMASATQQAKNMGLALSGETVDGMIDLQKQSEDLKLQLLGIGVQLGTNVIPLLSELAKSAMTVLSDPAVKAGIDAFNGGIRLTTDMVKELREQFPSVKSEFTQAFYEMGPVLDWTSTLFSNMGVVFQTWWDNEVSYFKFLGAIFAGDWEAAGTELGAITGRTFDLLDAITSGRLKSLGDIWNFGLDDLFLLVIGANDWEEAGKIIMEMIKKGLMFGIDDLFKLIWDTLTNIAKTVKEFSSGFSSGFSSADISYPAPALVAPAAGTSYPKGYGSFTETSNGFNEPIDYDRLARAVRDGLAAER